MKLITHSLTTDADSDMFKALAIEYTPTYDIPKGSIIYCTLNNKLKRLSFEKFKDGNIHMSPEDDEFFIFNTKEFILKQNPSLFKTYKYDEPTLIPMNSLFVIPKAYSFKPNQNIVSIEYLIGNEYVNIEVSKFGKDVMTGTYRNASVSFETVSISIDDFNIHKIKSFTCIED